MIMVEQRRRPVKKRRKLIGSESEVGKRESEASKFMSSAIDHILHEILIRLPDYRCVIQCSLVCKRWFSLIVDSPYNNNYYYFSRSFTHHHLRSKPISFLPYTLLIGGGFAPWYDSRRRFLESITNYNYFSRKSEALHGQLVHQRPMPWPVMPCNGYLDFVKFRNVIRSSFDDLLLIQETPSQFYICNPLTKQLAKLPQAPFSYRSPTCGFVCERMSTSIRFRVVLKVALKTLEYCTEVFSSETGKWKRRTFKLPMLQEVWGSGWYPTSVACNGSLYWPLMKFFVHLKGIIAFQPFKKTWRLVGLPATLLENAQYGEEGYGCPRLAVVRGRLRLAQSCCNSGFVILRVWEPNLSSDDWTLVHDVRVKTRIKYFCLLGLCPESEEGDDDGGDEFLFFCKAKRYINNAIYKYKIGRDSFEKVSDTIPVNTMANRPLFANVFTLLHPPLPTKIPTLPC